MKLMESRVFVALQKALDGSATRHRTIAHNIANVNTPGYKRLTVSFEDQLSDALADSAKVPISTTHPGHVGTKTTMSQVTPRISRDKSTSMRPDKNNVDMDQEMTNMATNFIYYNTGVGQLNKRIALLKHIISEGRR